MGYIEQFTSTLLEYSESTTYDEAIQEWVHYGESFDKANHCICGHDIIENCPVRNKKNGNVLIVGNCCIKKFGIEREHYNKSRRNYLEYALAKAHNDRSKEFVQELISILEKYGTLHMSPKQLDWLQKIANVPYRWEWRWNR